MEINVRAMHNFKELKIWQLSRQLVKGIYVLTADFPAEEKFGLISQLRRCAISIPANIAEGAGRNTNKDFSHFLNITLGSSYELETLLILALDIQFLTEERQAELSNKILEIQKMIFGLIKTLRQESYV